MRRRVLSVAVAAAALATAGVAAASDGGAKAGASLANHVSAAYAKVGAVTVSETGFVSMTARQGRVWSFRWLWGTGAVPHGWVPARESEVAALHDGQVVWWRDDLTPPSCHASRCSQVPVEIVVDRAGAFFAFGSAARHTCYGRLRGSTPVVAGTSWGALHGTFSAPIQSGSSLVLRAAYPWGAQTATETAVIDAVTRLVRSGTIHITGGGRPALTARFADGYPAKVPRAPRVKLCGG